jgi:hypothetical protein
MKWLPGNCFHLFRTVPPSHPVENAMMNGSLVRLDGGQRFAAK